MLPVTIWPLHVYEEIKFIKEQKYDTSKRKNEEMYNFSMQMPENILENIHNIALRATEIGENISVDCSSRVSEQT